LISILRLFFIFLILGLIPGLIGQLVNHCKITGKIVDANTDGPVNLVNVYLSGTTFGASTSQAGIYLMENIQPGSYQLIFQHIGYEIKVKNIQLEANQMHEIHAQLLPKIYAGEEIQVSTTEPKEWRKQLKVFLKEFIGESQNASDCEILNPEVLNFQFNPDSKEFIANTDSIIRIKNRSLGYQINLVLTDFKCRNDILSRYLIHPKFEVLEARNEKEQKKWVRNRRSTYLGSFKHFLHVLVDDNVEEEYFKLSTSLEIKRLRLGYGRFIFSESLRISTGDSPLYKKFFLNGYLKVSYGNNPYRQSIIKFKHDYIIIDKLGNVLTPEFVKKAGEWYMERVADLLPMEYVITN
jgi:hypothetical protein